MILLDTNQYDKVIKPLREVTINNLFARAVVENHVTGSVYVDDIDAPTTFYVVHPYGMTLLFGTTENKDFNANFAHYALNKDNFRQKQEWMQAYPQAWDSTLKKLLGEHLIKSADNIVEKTGVVELNTRVNFKFNPQKYADFKRKLPKPDFEICRTDSLIFEQMNGSVVPKSFWDNATDFEQKGAGFSLIYKHQLAATAFSSCVLDRQLEIGIETIPTYRGKGFAQYVCAALIEFCLNNDFEPVWACRLENIGSYKLAQILGFEPTFTLPYYKLA